MYLGYNVLWMLSFQFETVASFALQAPSLRFHTAAAPFGSTCGGRVLSGGASLVALSSSSNNEDTNGMREEMTILTNQRVAVAGATGRLGRYVVQELRDRRQVETVVALVRSKRKAQEIWGSSLTSNLEIIECDLTNEQQVQQALSQQQQQVDAVIWCATGFSSASSSNWIERLQRLFGLATQQPSIDTVGLPLLARALSPPPSSSSTTTTTPRIVMCSSAGVTRPQWSAEKKQRLIGASDIPIVRLNPFGILDIKFESEETLRRAARSRRIPYCIVRPSGLNDDNWPAGSRPLVSQGDVAVGRIHRHDVARVLVDVLTIPEAVDKTFEVMSVAQYPAPRSLRPALARLVPDGQVLDEARIEATYHVLQQLLPGETQAANQLAMGQTYEQLDKGETGRLGPRGKENIQAAGIAPSNKTTST